MHPRLRNAAQTVIRPRHLYAEHLFSDGIIARGCRSRRGCGGSLFSRRNARGFPLVGVSRANVALGLWKLTDGGPFVLRARLDASRHCAGHKSRPRVAPGGRSFQLPVSQPFLSSTTSAHLNDPTPHRSPACHRRPDVIYDDHCVLVPLCPPGFGRITFHSRSRATSPGRIDLARWS